MSFLKISDSESIQMALHRENKRMEQDCHNVMFLIFKDPTRVEKMEFWLEQLAAWQKMITILLDLIWASITFLVSLVHHCCSRTTYSSSNSTDLNIFWFDSSSSSQNLHDNSWLLLQQFYSIKNCVERYDETQNHQGFLPTFLLLFTNSNFCSQISKLRWLIDVQSNPHLTDT